MAYSNRFSALIVMLCVAHVSYATAIDSLKAILNKHPEPSIERLEALNKLAGKLRNRQPKVAMPYAKEALEIATQLGQEQQAGIANILIAQAYFFMGDMENVKAPLAEAERLVRKTNDGEGFQKLINTRGLIWYSTGKIDSAVRAYRFGKRLAQFLNDKDGYAVNSTMLARCYNMQGKYRSAVSELNEALVVHQMRNKHSSLASVHINLGNTYFMMENFAKARPHYEAAHKNALLAEHDLIAANALSNLGLCQSADSLYEEAIESQWKADKIYIEQGSANMRAIGWSYVADVYQKMGQADSAGKYFRMAYNKMIELDMKAYLISAAVGYATARKKEGNFEEARRLLNQSLEIAQAAKDNYILKQVYSGLSEVEAKLNNYQAAYEYERKHNQIVKEMDETSQAEEIGALNAKYEQKLAEAEARREAEIKKRSVQMKKEQQFYLIFGGLGIVMAGLITLSGRLRAYPRLIEIVFFFFILMLFEAIIILLDPFVMTTTEGLPFPSLLVNGALAIVFSLAHQQIDRRYGKRLAKSN